MTISTRYITVVMGVLGMIVLGTGSAAAEAANGGMVAAAPPSGPAIST